MRTKIKLSILLFFLFIVGIALLPGILEVTEQEKTLPPIEAPSMIEIINRERQKNGLSLLVENSKLNESARLKSCHMREHNYFEHVSPDGVEPWIFFDKAGYNFQRAAENILKYSANAPVDMKIFMDSSSHRGLILSPDYKDIGVGRCGTYTTQHFGILPEPETGTVFNEAGQSGQIAK